MVGPMRKSLLSKAVTAVCATVMCLGVTACGGNSSAKPDKSNSDSSSSSEKIGMHQIAGVTAKGELGKKPTVSFKTSYLMVLTLVSKSKDLKKATGEKVAGVPADLPKVTLAKDGKPSIDMNGYKGSDSLVSQDLIKGKGAVVKDTQSVVAHYTGWLLDGTQFDSSWDRGQSSAFSLDSVIKGWKQGLAGHTVGSQVLLVVPPSLGYGNKDQEKIPANSTLVFVVDILAAY